MDSMLESSIFYVTTVPVPNFNDESTTTLDADLIMLYPKDYPVKERILNIINKWLVVFNLQKKR